MQDLDRWRALDEGRSSISWLFDLMGRQAGVATGTYDRVDPGGRNPPAPDPGAGSIRTFTG